MSKPLITIIKSTLAITALTLASTSAYAANLVGINTSAAWDMGMNHIMHAGASISASNRVTDKQAYTSDPALDGAGWGHLGSWYTFMTHEAATTTISATATDTAAMSPGFTVWRTNGEFDGGTASSGELSSAAKGTPHSFNQVGNAGDYGNYWMTDSSITNGVTANGITQRMGYANDGPEQLINGWGNAVLSDGIQDGHAELTLNNLAAGWYLVFLSGADGSLLGSNVNLKVSSVPVPAAVYLFGSALVGLVASSRKKLAA